MSFIFQPSLPLLLICLVHPITSDWSGAGFNGNVNGIEGFVLSGEGYVWMSINMSTLAKQNYSGLPGGASCFDGGLKYHIHEEWNYGNDTEDKMGATECGAAYTGGHWDPWLACGSASGDEYCTSQGGCVNSSSIINTKNKYECNTTNFRKEPYTCEVGDWSGKYGLLHIVNDSGTITDLSPFEVDGSDLDGYSVVFHCNDGTRAFCAPFVYLGHLFTVERPTQGNGSDGMGAFFNELEESMILLSEDSRMTVDIDISNIKLPSDCGDTLLYRIYDSWNVWDDLNSTDPYTSTMYKSSSLTDCSNYVGSFYDPTISCARDSGNIYCDSNGDLCSDSDYDYVCRWNNPSDRMYCAPGDLSGKFGALNISNGEKTFKHSLKDIFMIDLELLEGRSIVLQCNDTLEIVACAELEYYEVEAATPAPIDTDVITTLGSHMTTNQIITSTNTTAAGDMGCINCIQMTTVLIVMAAAIKTLM